MFRQGRNPKDTHTADDTADHTPQSPAPSGGYGAGGGATSAPPSGSTAATPTEAYQQQVYTQTTSRAVTESESLARDIKEGTLTGFVGNGTTLTGEANFKGMLRVDGGLSGRVSSADGTLIVSTNGRVDANVEVAVAQIFGTVNGDITATKRIELGRVAKVTGNIQTPALVIENGAIFEGNCRMAQVKEQAAQPNGDAAAASASATGSSSGSSASGSAGSGSAGSGSSGASGSGSGSSGSGLSKTSSTPSSSSSPSKGGSSSSDVTDATGAVS